MGSALAVTPSIPPAVLPEASLDGLEHVPSDRRVARDGHEAQPVADLRQYLNADPRPRPPRTPSVATIAPPGGRSSRRREGEAPRCYTWRSSSTSS